MTSNSTGSLLEAIWCQFKLDGTPDPRLGLIDDLGFDSLSLIELVLFIAEYTHATEDRFVDYPILETVEDAISYAEVLAALISHAGDESSRQSEQDLGRPLSGLT